MVKVKIKQSIFLVASILLLVYLIYPYYVQIQVDNKSKSSVQSIIQKKEEIRKEISDLGNHIEDDALYKAMCSYNEKLCSEQNIDSASVYQSTDFPIEDYGLSPSEPIGYITIPKMGIELPLYLGATSQNMNNGAAILGGTSLPVGGVSSNCVIAGHRGWNGAAFFRDIEKLEIGDYIEISNLWDELKYEVIDIKIISPDEIMDIYIQPGKDMVTLLTCHPYLSGGDQRYLVFCERVDETSFVQQETSIPQATENNNVENENIENSPKTSQTEILQEQSLRFIAIVLCLITIFLVVVDLLKSMKNPPRPHGEDDT